VTNRSTATAEPNLLPADDAPIAPVALVVSDNVTPMFERLAADNNVSVDKLERLVDLHERVLRQQAEAAFNADFALMLPKIPTIIERAYTDKTSYAPLEDIVEPIRPILSEFGFSLSFKTEWPGAKAVKVIGILTHKNGHSRTSEFMAQADNTGSKNEIQALGSSVSYGKRYTTKDLLCIVTRGEDDDARRAAAKAPKDEKPKPDKYENWIADLEIMASEGQAAFAKTWNESKQEFRNYITKNEPKRLAAFRTRAASAGR
jgi:hypothetical protein